MTFQTILLFLIAVLVGSDEFLLGPILTPIGADLGVAPERVIFIVAAYALPGARHHLETADLELGFRRIDVRGSPKMKFRDQDIPSNKDR